jgi:hypothetical protein
MKKVLLLMVSALMISSVAMATPHFGLYSDCSGTSCVLAGGFTTTNALVEKFAVGTTGCRLKVDMSLAAVGSSIFAFTTPFVPIGNISNDLSLGYGLCIDGTVCLGTLVMSFGVGNSTVSVTKADGFPYIIYTDCAFGEYEGHGGTAYVGNAGDCQEPNPTQPSTWGQVKALYR